MENTKQRNIDDQYNDIMEKMILNFRLLYELAKNNEIGDDELETSWYGFEDARKKMNELFDKINK